MSVSPSKNRPIVLANSCTKSRADFRTLRWHGRRHFSACQYWRKLYRLDDGRFKCAQCHYRFSEWTGTYLERLRIPLHELAHLLYLFTLGVPSYRSQRYVGVSPKTAQKVYTTIRQSLYDQSLIQLTTDRLSGEVELDETMYGGHRKGKRGWGAAGETLNFWPLSTQRTSADVSRAGSKNRYLDPLGYGAYQSRQFIL